MNEESMTKGQAWCQKKVRKASDEDLKALKARSGLYFTIAFIGAFTVNVAIISALFNAFGLLGMLTGVAFAFLAGLLITLLSIVAQSWVEHEAKARGLW